MSALLERQREFADALTGSLYGIAEKVIGDAIPAEGRLQIYADRFRASLLDVLANTFPVTRGLVGEAFFAQTARAFLIFDPPRSPLLWQYGHGFPTFLAALPDLGGHQYLPDIAAFEWALNLAEHAEDVDLLRAEDLPDAIETMTFTLHPSAQRLSTPFPISEIWQVHQPESPLSSASSWPAVANACWSGAAASRSAGTSCSTAKTACWPNWPTASRSRPRCRRPACMRILIFPPASAGCWMAGFSPGFLFKFYQSSQA